MAREFNKNLIEMMETSMIIVVTTCRVSQYRDLQLSPSVATYYYFSLDILEVEQSQAEFSCEATITNVNGTRNWFYISCIECTKMVKENGGVWKCMDLIDALTQRECPELVCKLGISNPQQIPPKVLAVEGRKHMFQFHFSTYSKIGVVDFTLDDMLMNLLVLKEN
uniref:Uncharacterized protein n=1 Tax=Tanacetum cinerariifolium TaxID=118510 RepID=A0A699GMX6_TANCI|nr:hypothetical protein [Tanacetum cinerariifolium]